MISNLLSDLAVIYVHSPPILISKKKSLVGWRHLPFLLALDLLGVAVFRS